jgi:hypothetical protein
MSNKMRWYTISFWIFLTLSVSHQALAVPLAVGEIVEVRSNPIQVFNDGATWEKRMDPDYKDQLSTNDVQLPDGGAPGVVQEGVDAEGVKPKQTWGWGWDSELPLDLKDSWSAVRGSAASHNNPTNNPPKEESDGGNGGGGDHATESSQGSAENISPGPQPEHPATPDFMTSLKEWFYKSPGDVPKVFRPRSRTAGAPKGVSGNR